MTNPPTIQFTRDDHAKLSLLLAATLGAKPTPALQRLRDDLARAIVLDPTAFPEDVVALGSKVEFEDLGDGSIEEFQITFPERADVAQQRVSVLAPIGAALIGHRAGDEVNWVTPGGTRRLRILRVTPPPPVVTTPTVVPPFSLASLAQS